MARKSTKTQQDQAHAQPDANPEKVDQSDAALRADAGAGNPDQSGSNAETKETPEKGSGDDQGTKPDDKDSPPEKASSDRTRGGMVDAKLKTRHCRGGICREAGETMPMTRGEYERLKKYDRVE